MSAREGSSQREGPRVVAFLGTGKYEETCYVHEGRARLRTRFVTRAIAHLWGAREAVVLATRKAQEENGPGLEEAFRDGPPLRIVPIPDGKDEQELWAIFQALAEALGEPPVILDITHGFRAQPFFAAGALAMLRAAGRLGRGEAQVLYGRYLQEEPEESPIWDLTLLLDLVAWAHGAATFARTGNPSLLIETAEGAWAERVRTLTPRGGRFPKVQVLVNALRRFGEDLATIRVASLVTGYEQAQDKKHKARGSARALREALERYREEVVEVLPPFGPVLDRVREVVEGLEAERLASPEGQRALLALARRYLDFQRYPEAAVVLREGDINRYGGPEAVEVNSASFNREARREAEGRWAEQEDQGVADVRNDIEHGGFRRQPHQAQVLIDRLERLWEEAKTRWADAPPRREPGRIWLVTRHSGAAEWCRRQGLAPDRVVAHLDPGEVRPGDVVVGTLPVHLVAALNKKGARYVHLAVEVPPEARGKELSAEDLERFGARLEAYGARREELPSGVRGLASAATKEGSP